VTWLGHDTSEGIWALVNRIADTVGLPLTHAEPLQVVHYAQGQQYRQHWDAYDAHSERGKQVITSSGNRLLTALGYINTVDGGSSGAGNEPFPPFFVSIVFVPSLSWQTTSWFGCENSPEHKRLVGWVFCTCTGLEGGTRLPNINVTVPAVAGRLLIFHTTYPGTATKHVDGLHAGTPVAIGEKWAFNLWFHDRPYRQSVMASKRMLMRQHEKAKNAKETEMVQTDEGQKTETETETKEAKRNDERRVPAETSGDAAGSDKEL
jgi:prolyl 4-hydroxylase